MRLHNLHFRTLLVLSFFVFLIMIPAANAGHNINIVQIHQESLDASISVYLAFSSVYRSFVLLEEGKLTAANSLWKEKVLSNIGKAKGIYEKSVPKLAEKRWHLVDGVPPESQPMILKDLGRYDIPLPVSLRALGRVAEKELRELEGFFAQVRFEKDVTKNRELLRKINYRITRFISLGISLSTISMWNK